VRGGPKFYPFLRNRLRFLIPPRPLSTLMSLSHLVVAHMVAFIYRLNPFYQAFFRC
jgi:membrane-bound metal-dependent hydrolase YbcI (DUF457 family)